MAGCTTYNQTLSAKDQTVDDISWNALIYLGLFADRRGIPTLLNAVADLFIAKLKSTPVAMLHEKCAYIYSHTGNQMLLALKTGFFKHAPEEDLLIEFICDVALA